MSHLGDRAAAIADGQLDHDERDRALAHLAGCDRCRSEVEAQRRTKAVIASLDGPRPPAGLLESLSRLGGPGGASTAVRRLPDRGASVPAAWRVPDRPLPGRGSAARVERHRRPGPGRPAGQRNGSGIAGRLAGRGLARTGLAGRARPAVRVAALSVLSAAAVTLGLAGLGAPTSVDPAPAAVVPPLERFSLQHSRSTGQLPFTEPALVSVPSTTWTGTPTPAGADGP